MRTKIKIDEERRNRLIAIEKEMNKLNEERSKLMEDIIKEVCEKNFA